MSDMMVAMAAVSDTNEDMPLVSRLLLQDNEIDGCGPEGLYAPVSCMETMKR